jgi:hypothetical protein
MEKKKLDWIISIIREEMTANAPGASGGFSGSADPKGPVAGFDPVMRMDKRNRLRFKLPAGLRNRWKKQPPPQQQ